MLNKILFISFYRKCARNPTVAIVTLLRASDKSWFICQADACKNACTLILMLLMLISTSYEVSFINLTFTVKEDELYHSTELCA